LAESDTRRFSVERLVARTQLGLIAFEEVQMSYRNDHDAALNRVAALERELAMLKSEPQGTKKNEEDEDELRVSEHGGEHKLMGVLVGGAAAILCIVGLMWRVTSQMEAAPVVDEEDVPAKVVAPLPAPSLVDNDACAMQIERWAVRDAAFADPRGVSPRPAAELMRGVAPCSAGDGDASAEVLNVSSLITVYYENDPVALDGYQSAEQLWREYHRARAKRWN
jgi:hypothetical protein